MATVQKIDWQTFFANVYQVDKAYVSIEKIGVQKYAFDVSIPVKKDTVNSTLATLSQNRFTVNQSLKDKVTSVFANQMITMPTVQSVNDQKFKMQTDTGFENVRVVPQSVEAVQHLQVTATGVHVAPKTTGVQEEVLVLFDLPPVTRGKSMNIVTTFTVDSSDTTKIEILCGWKSHAYPMATSVTSGTYTFTISSRTGKPLLRLEKQGEAEPLNVLQMDSPTGGEPPEINHLRAFEPDSWVYDYIHNLFQNSALGFKISHMTGKDSIRDVTIRVQ